jgi:hypothetical protein
MAAAIQGNGKGGIPWRILGWGALAALLALPAVAMQLKAPGVHWTAGDFVFAAVLFALLGGGIELAVRMSSNLAARAGAAVAVLAAFLTIWVNLAVGMIGPEGNPYNLLFLGVLGLALAGTLAARFRPGGTARAMAAAALAHAAVAAGGMSTDMPGAVFSLAFVVPWLVAAALFAKAAREEGRAV